MRWVEGHISHCSRVLRRCHPERSSCSGEFGCRSLMKKTRLEQFVFYLLCEKTCVFLSATIRLKFTEHFNFRFWIRNQKPSSKSIKFDLPNYLSCRRFKRVRLTLLPFRWRNDSSDSWLWNGFVWRALRMKTNNIINVFFSLIFILLCDSRKIHFLSHEFGVKLYLKGYNFCLRFFHASV